MEYLTTYIDT